MEENFVGYLLDSLDEATKLQVEAYVQEHPEALAKLTLLKRGMAPLEADLDQPAPAPLLAERTLARVAEHACASVDPMAALPKAPPVTPASLRFTRPWWRRADVMVAAALLITVTGIGVTVLTRMQVPSSESFVIACKNNLREFFSGLKGYQDLHGHLPNLVDQAPYDVAGIAVPLLVEAGVLPETASIRCPAMGPPMSCDFTMEDLRAMSAASFRPRSTTLSVSYAYSLGYRDDDGDWHTPGESRDLPLSETPIMADRPPSEGIIRNSANHGGTGQNVLFGEGHVRFLHERSLGTIDSDIFLNRDNRVAAGRGPRDIVLGYSAARP